VAKIVQDSTVLLIINTNHNEQMTSFEKAQKWVIGALSPNYSRLVDPVSPADSLFFGLSETLGDFLHTVSCLPSSSSKVAMQKLTIFGCWLGTRRDTIQCSKGELARLCGRLLEYKVHK